MQPLNYYDVIVIGSGAAGLALALQVAARYRVAVLSKQALSSSSTYNAQGGIAAVLDTETDNLNQHIHDTLVAGAGLCHPNVVKHIVQHSQACIHWLSQQGVPFTTHDHRTNNLNYHLTREGGHSTRRIIHADDVTGRALVDTLTTQVKQRDNIDLFEHHLAIDLIAIQPRGDNTRQCIGIYVLDRQTEQIRALQSRCTVLASGGASKAYLYTSNPDVATGDGIAMAWRAGCRVANLEFNQFHPTCLYHPHAKACLISEAVRGEGGKLLRPDGSRFMPAFDARAELAPRDIVARAIDHEMKRLGADCLFLDISHKPTAFIQAHFPTIRARCLDYGIDITREPIPIVPAAHYTCGGIVVDLRGQTDLPGLLAIGECAFTGAHGANRLASNSLLECFVSAHSTAAALNDTLPHWPIPPAVPDWDETQVTDADENIVIAHNWDELRRFMWDYVGIVRTTKRLQRAAHRIRLLQSEIHEFYSQFKISHDLIELRNLAQVADLIIQCAMARKESRGLHYTLDYPHTLKQANDTVLTPPNWQAETHQA